MLSIIQAAGWPIWFIIMCSVICVAIIGERFWTLRRSAVLPPNLFQDTIQAFRAQGVTADLITKLNENSFLGRVFASGLANVKSSRDVMKESMEEAGRAVLVDMERFLTGLGTIATDVLKNTSTASVSLKDGGASNPKLTDRQIQKQSHVSALRGGL